jgi:hypothetical protein
MHKYFGTIFVLNSEMGGLQMKYLFAMTDELEEVGLTIRE